ncbi:site-specific DNA-methyltransferase [Parvibacter caecicola]|uniref:Adenine-specific DNA-methyltransferase n=1 Tax=Parvibacter caecicola TaxID=747645 RepID=A0A7W5D210_9ACTN|nr:site-specific DNA-methyltransferase [Parvibacter caecicola]MBB3171021.1 adenine-specific DNA-methyltransferase [Parvibacter caecicola]MCR2042184.1 site-specific DNA-methyltransferase [Parvibacter caecicola]RNL10945.1 site-specific DNA-methyltransferase [Parvibacter caecicola]
MEKIDTRTPDLTEENIKKLIELFPQVATEVEGDEGQIERAVDFDALRDLLGDVAEGQRERYQFTWPGKREAKAEARRPIDKTMIPCPEKSVDWDTTENLYIEGDNLDALKLLKETYAGKIKFIYIDPPYNTGNDFIYDDDFTISKENYEGGEVSVEGRLVANPDSNGRFHSDWCSMIYPRLLISRDLLTSDGLIIVSIDDNEMHNLRKMCSEIYGDDNFIAELVWEKKKKGSFLAKSITTIKEYLLVYAKNRSSSVSLISDINTDTETYPCVNAPNPREIRRIPAGIESKYKEKNFFLSEGSEISDTTMSLVLHSDLVINDGVLAEDLVIEGNWRYSQEMMTQFALNKELYLTRDLYLRRIVNDARLKPLKDILPRVGEQEAGARGGSIDLDKLSNSGWGSNEDADEELRLLFGVQRLLDYPKPVRLILKLLASIRDQDCTVLDFFSGSATTAEAVMRLNYLDGGNRKFILVQLPEETKTDSVANKAGYTTIVEIGEERIRRAGAKIVEESDEKHSQLELGSEPKPVPDIGFRVLRIDSSNFKDTHLTPGQADQASLLDAIDNVKNGRTAEDILFQVLPAFRIPYSAHIEKLDINGKKVFDVNHGQLLACFDADVTNDIIEEIARRKPSYAVMRDLSFKDDSAAANFEELFKTFSPDTIRRVI